jgi:hypothetical protein
MDYLFSSTGGALVVGLAMSGLFLYFKAREERGLFSYFSEEKKLQLEILGNTTNIDLIRDTRNLSTKIRVFPRMVEHLIEELKEINEKKQNYEIFRSCVVAHLKSFRDFVKEITALKQTFIEKYENYRAEDLKQFPKLGGALIQFTELLNSEKFNVLLREDFSVYEDALNDKNEREAREDIVEMLAIYYSCFKFLNKLF